MAYDASRISRYQQKKMLKQTLVLLFFSIALLSLFFFVLLPTTARLYTMFGPKSQQSQQTTTFPPQTPVLEPLPEATNSATITIQGFGEANTTMSLVNNGAIVTEAKSSADGKFAFSSVMLTPGENEFIVVSTSNTLESRSTPQIVTLKTDKPTLTVTAPQDGMVVTRSKEQLQTVQGKTDKGVRVYLNGRLLFADANGNFSGTFQLAQGDNTLHFQAVDTAGNTAEKDIKVSYQP